MTKRLLTHLAFPLAICAAPLSAQTANPSFDLANAAYDLGKQSGATPQTRGEYLMCAGHWEALFRASRGGMLTLEDFEQLPAEIAGADLQAARNHFLDLYGDRIEEHWDRYEARAASAGEVLGRFRSGEIEATNQFFGMMGVCSAPVAQAQPSLSLAEARASVAGSWTGELQYRDYQSDRWIGIPVQVEVELVGDGVTQITRAVFDDGASGSVYITSVDMLADDGTTQYTSMFRADRAAELGTTSLRLSEAQDASNWTIVSEREGMDDNRPAMIRETTRREGDSLVTLKQVDFQGDGIEEWLSRNRTVLTRVGD